MKKLTDKEKRFVKARVEGKNRIEAFKEAGYSVSQVSHNSNKVAASKVNSREHVQQAIDAALQKGGLTPEYAVEKLKEVIDQDKEIGAKRLAIKDALELMGWNKMERPQNVLAINNAFFNESRTTTQNQE